MAAVSWIAPQATSASSSISTQSASYESATKGRDGAYNFRSIAIQLCRLVSGDVMGCCSFHASASGDTTSRTCAV